MMLDDIDQNDQPVNHLYILVATVTIFPMGIKGWIELVALAGPKSLERSTRGCVPPRHVRGKNRSAPMRTSGVLFIQSCQSTLTSVCCEWKLAPEGWRVGRSDTHHPLESRFD